MSGSKDSFPFPQLIHLRLQIGFALFLALRILKTSSQTVDSRQTGWFTKDSFKKMSLPSMRMRPSHCAPRGPCVQRVGEYRGRVRGAGGARRERAHGLPAMHRAA